MKEITIPFPDDWHCHLRDHNYLARTVADESQRFARAIVMPNLVPPITTVKVAKAYHTRIIKALPEGRSFQPLMTLYLTESLSPTEIHEGKRSGLITACKLYPAGATTHSDAGITKLNLIYPLIEAMQINDMPLLIHGEVVDPKVNIIEQEARFIEEQLIPLIRDFPDLRIVLEHISTKTAVDFIQSCKNNIAATITPHHLLLNLNDLLDKGIRPHYYCKPIVKQLEDQQALIKAATSGKLKFFLGTDSAPHNQASKECSSGCAGIYSAHAAIELYANVFEQQEALDKLADFASRFGPSFYKLPVNTNSLTLIRKPWQVPSSLTFGNEQLIPLFAGQILNWQIKNEKSTHP